MCIDAYVYIYIYIYMGAEEAHPAPELAGGRCPGKFII